MACGGASQSVRRRLLQPRVLRLGFLQDGGVLETRDRLFRELPAALDENEQGFLRTLVRAEPDWSLLGIPHLEELPAIRWRLENLQSLARSNPEGFRGLANAWTNTLETRSHDREAKVRYLLYSNVLERQLGVSYSGRDNCGPVMADRDLAISEASAVAHLRSAA